MSPRLRPSASRTSFPPARTRSARSLPAGASEEFGTWWAQHNVRYHRTGSKRLRHPVVGELELEYEVMDVSADDGLTIAVYSAEPGSRSAEALDLLASWTATPAHAIAPTDE